MALFSQAHLTDVPPPYPPTPPGQREWSYLAQAEDAERARREVVLQAAPLAQTAEASEAEALRLRQQAQDTRRHAEVGGRSGVAC